MGESIGPSSFVMGPKGQLRPRKRVRHPKNPHGEPPRFCKVCEDHAINYNYGVITCESCKAFFRRNTSKVQRLVCAKFEEKGSDYFIHEGLFPSHPHWPVLYLKEDSPLVNDMLMKQFFCIINYRSRKTCTYCRLVKCFLVGMRREWSDVPENQRRDGRSDLPVVRLYNPALGDSPTEIGTSSTMGLSSSYANNTTTTTITTTATTTMGLGDRNHDRELNEKQNDNYLLRRNNDLPTTTTTNNKFFDRNDNHHHHQHQHNQHHSQNNDSDVECTGYVPGHNAHRHHGQGQGQRNGHGNIAASKYPRMDYYQVENNYFSNRHSMLPTTTMGQNINERTNNYDVNSNTNNNNNNVSSRQSFYTQNNYNNPYARRLTGNLINTTTTTSSNETNISQDHQERRRQHQQHQQQQQQDQYHFTKNSSTIGINNDPRRLSGLSYGTHTSAFVRPLPNSASSTVKLLQSLQIKTLKPLSTNGMIKIMRMSESFENFWLEIESINNKDNNNKSHDDAAAVDLQPSTGLLNQDEIELSFYRFIEIYTHKIVLFLRTLPEFNDLTYMQRKKALVDRVLPILPMALIANYDSARGILIIKTKDGRENFLGPHTIFPGGAAQANEQYMSLLSRLHSFQQDVGQSLGLITCLMAIKLFSSLIDKSMTDWTVNASHESSIVISYTELMIQYLRHLYPTDYERRWNQLLIWYSYMELEFDSWVTEYCRDLDSELRNDTNNKVSLPSNDSCLYNKMSTACDDNSDLLRISSESSSNSYSY